MQLYIINLLNNNYIRDVLHSIYLCFFNEKNKHESVIGLSIQQGFKVA